MTLFKKLLRRAMISTCISAGILAITNLESLYHDPAHYDDVAVHKLNPPRALESRLPKLNPSSPKSEVLAELRRSLGNVELGRVNPFAELRDLKPLESVLARGAIHFKRQSYRSPRYQEESGYDLVSFEVEHIDHTKSTVVAYLERTLEGPDLVPVVLLVTNGPEHARQVLYRAGEVADNQVVPLSVAQNMVAQRLNSGVPFLSVAR